MQTQNIQVAHPEPQPELKIPWLSRLGGMLLSPKSTLTYAKGQPDWFLPYLIMANLALVSAISTFFIGLFRLQVSIIILLAPVMVLVFIPVIWGVQTGTIYLLGRIFGGKAHFYPLFCVLGYAHFPQFLRKLLMSGMAFIGWRIRVPGSLAAFIPLNFSGVRPSLSFVLANSIEPFRLWTLALIILGIALVFRFRAGKAITIGILYWALSRLVAIGLSSLMSFKMVF